MEVIKRNGQSVEFNPNKILNRIKKSALIHKKSPLNIHRVKTSLNPGRSPETVTTRIPRIYFPRNSSE